MSRPSNETEKNGLKNKKRKHSLIKDDLDSSLSNSIIKKSKRKKKKNSNLSNGFFFPEQNSEKYLKYKNTKNYTSVVAKPESLQVVPKIFRMNKFKNSYNFSPESFLFNLISRRSFNPDISQRFNHFALINQNCSYKSVSNGLSEELNTTNSEYDNWERGKKKRKKCRDVYLDEENSSLFEDEEKEIPLSKIKLYKTNENKGVIFHMPHKSSFSFHGEIKVTVLSGEVEILGYTLSHSSSGSSVNVYSPHYCTKLVIQTKPPKEKKPKPDVESVLRNYLIEKDLECILTDLHLDDSVLFIEFIDSVFGKVLNKYCQYILFSKNLVDCQFLKSLESVFELELSQKGNHFKKNVQWDSIPLGGCTVLCGGKGVGKSTLLRYYVNKLVSQGEKVLCLDFDVGQTEFTAPGCVSAVVVDQPLLGPNFTHVTDPALMIYFGDIDVTPNPSGYLECVKFVIDSCKKNDEFSKMKWLVNTMGYSKGLGVYLMISTLKLLQPNTVIQIQGSFKNNYSFFLTPRNLNSMAGFKSMPLEDVQVFHELRIVKSYSCKNGCGKKGEPSQGPLEPRQLRDIMSLSYFSRVVSPPYYNFNAVQPYLIPFSQLYLGIRSLINFNDILKAFNANIVSLLHLEPDSEEEQYSVDSEEDDYFKIVVKPKLTPSLGLGFVRGIDCKEKKFYILTHLPLEAVNQVNCLCLEKINPPHSMFLKQETVDGLNVYTTIGTANVIQRVKRMFHGSAATQIKPNV